jgi:hypothetical protein
MARNRAWARANKATVNASNRRSKERDPERVTRVRKAWEERNRAAYNAKQNEGLQRRKARKAGILLVVRVQADYCGVCLGPLVQQAAWPDNRATTVGHEPPLAVAAREGWRVVAERPEHFVCNRRKWARTDAEMVAA